jgi:hypothetical protein
MNKRKSKLIKLALTAPDAKANISNMSMLVLIKERTNSIMFKCIFAEVSGLSHLEAEFTIRHGDYPDSVWDRYIPEVEKCVSEKKASSKCCSECSREMNEDECGDEDDAERVCDECVTANTKTKVSDLKYWHKESAEEAGKKWEKESYDRFMKDFEYMGTVQEADGKFRFIYRNATWDNPSINSNLHNADIQRA